MNEKTQTSAFRKKYKIKTVNSAELSRALQEQGYTIVPFNGLSDRRPVADLIDALRVRDLVASSRCFAYQDTNTRLIFLHEDLNEEERTIALAHEEGHIWNRHMDRRNIVGNDVIEEYEANEFAHYLLAGRNGVGRRRLAVSIIFALCVAFCIITGVSLRHYHNRSIYTRYYYRVSDGKKYHLQGCIYIKDRKDATRLTWEEYESGEFTACSVCRPDEYTEK